MNLEGKLQAPLEIVQQIGQRQEWKLLQSKRIIHRGHSLFQFDWSTGILEAVVYEHKPLVKENPFPILQHGERIIEPAEHKAKHHSVKYNENCLYIAALNLDSAKKKLQKYYPQLKKFTKVPASK